MLPFYFWIILYLEEYYGFFFVHSPIVLSEPLVGCCISADGIWSIQLFICGTPSVSPCLYICVCECACEHFCIYMEVQIEKACGNNFICACGEHERKKQRAPDLMLLICISVIWRGASFVRSKWNLTDDNWWNHFKNVNFCKNVCKT